MAKLGDDVDKTPASVTKYKSGKRSCFNINLDNNKKNLSKQNVNVVMTQLVKESCEIKNEEMKMLAAHQLEEDNALRYRKLSTVIEEEKKSFDEHFDQHFGSIEEELHLAKTNSKRKPKRKIGTRNLQMIYMEPRISEEVSKSQII